MSYYNDVENKPKDMIVISGRDGSRQLPRENDPTGYAPLLSERSASQTLQTILATPAPVPSRRPETVRRERHEGASEQSTPIMRAVASAIRSSKYLVIVSIAGMVTYVAVPSVSGVGVTIGALVAMSVVMLIFDAMEYRHSQAGIERLRAELDSRDDSRLASQYEDNRHNETMTAITGDLEIKLKVLDLAAGYARLPDKRGES